MIPATITTRNHVRDRLSEGIAISLLLPFNPKITAKQILARRLELAVMQVKDELDKQFQIEETYELMVRLRKLVAELNYAIYKRSVAIYLSANTEHVFYLDLDVNERVVASGAFTMRHIIENKTDDHNCLLLVLSGERIKIFHTGTHGLKRLLSVTPHSMSSRQDHLPECVGGFSDPSALKETMLDKFMRYADHSLSLILNCYAYPVIVMATERTGGHFKKITANDTHIATFIHGNFEDATESALRQSIEPYIEQWDRMKQKHLLEKLEKAMGAGKVAAGPRSVCKEAQMQKGRLLLIEKNYKYKLDIAPAHDKAPKPFYLQDKIDEAILNVLESGGDVEFVDDGALAQYGHIAMIKYY